MLPVTPTTSKPLPIEEALKKPFLPSHKIPLPSTFARAYLFTGVRIRHGSEPASLHPKPTPYDSIAPPVDTVDSNVGENQENDNQQGQGQNGNQNDSSNRKGKSKEKEKKQHGDRKGKGKEKDIERSDHSPESISTYAQSHIFAGCTFFIQNSPGYQDNEGHETLTRRIETNGGKIGDSPLLSSVTHIIVKVPIGIDILIHFPPSPSASAADVVLSMDQITSLAETTTPSALAQSGWGIYDLLSKFGLRKYEGGPVLLRSEWIKACIVKRRPIGEEDNWGGHRVFASVESTGSPLPEGTTHVQSPLTPLIDVNRYSARSSLPPLSVSPSQSLKSSTRLPAISTNGPAATSTSAASSAISASTIARPPGTSLPILTPTASRIEQVQRPVLRQYQQSRRRLSLPPLTYFARIPRIAPPPATVVNLHRPIHSPLPSAAGRSRTRSPPITTPVQDRPQRRHSMSLPSISILPNLTNLYQYGTGTQSSRLSDSLGASARRDRLHPYALPQIQPQPQASAGPSRRLMLPRIQGDRATRTRMRDSLPSLASVLAGMSGYSVGTASDGEDERTMRIGERLHHPITSTSLGQQVPSVTEPVLNARSNPGAISRGEERGILSSPRLRRMAGRNFHTSQPPSENQEGVRQNQTSPTGSNTNAGESSRRGLLTRSMLPLREQYEYSRVNQFPTASTNTALSDRGLLSVPIHPHMNIPVPSASFSLFIGIKFFCHPFDPEIARAVIDWGRGELSQMHQANIVIFVRPIDTSSSSSNVRRSHYQPKDDIERTILRAALQAGKPHIVSSEWVYDSLAARTTLPVKAYNIRFPIQPPPPPPPPGSMEEEEAITIPSQSAPGENNAPGVPSSSTATATNPASGTGPYPSPLRWRHYVIGEPPPQPQVPSMRLPPSLYQVDNPNISSIKALLAQRYSIAASSASAGTSARARAKRLRQESVISLSSPEQQELRTKKREEKRAKRAEPKSTNKSTREQKQKVGSADAKENETYL